MCRWHPQQPLPHHVAITERMWASHSQVLTTQGVRKERRHDLSRAAIPKREYFLGRDMGGVQNVWGEENVPENALSRKFLDPSKRASGLLCRGFLYRKNRALTPEGGGNRTV